MGQNAAETLNEIEASRQRLQHDIDVLESRLPPTDELVQRAKVIGAAAAAAGVGLLVVYVLTKRSVARRRDHREAIRQADALVEVLEDRGVVVRGAG